MRRVILASMAAAAMAMALPLTALAQNVEVAGVKYEPTAEVGGAKLQLNGAGIRYKAFFKVYTAGLYLAAKATSPEAVLGATGAKRLHIQMLREIDGNELGKLFTKGMEDNSTREEFSKAINGVLRVAEIFSSKKRMSTGEHFSVDWVPGTGTVVYVNGKVQGEPIKEAEFYNVLLKIWLGKSPADEQLKDALLGIKRERSGRG
ncbi:chalcone isomerase family protein [Paucibacter sediminis]|uniref:Chalcone isomerase family protein n=1 Tax=Paucibacter sediminis TaxID=3019553 RepID=A0AA95NGJ0_9BURK|nr:chalcone isomerase family protein [Paucibacter sp. S2-9]WIT13944.1 chalcone isomerase family protein [Paucibacter sp. S2-9]